MNFGQQSLNLEKMFIAIYADTQKHFFCLIEIANKYNKNLLQ